MKKYVGKDGGRYIYNDDLISIQDTAFAAIQSLFGEFGNMIVSGVSLDTDTKRVSEGYVYINNYLRKINSQSVSGYPFYIMEKNRSISYKYQNEQSQVGAIAYEAVIVTKEPIDVIDPITKEGAQYITVESESDIPNLKNIFFGEYSLLKKSNKKQTISGDVDITGRLDIKTALKVSDTINVGASSIVSVGNKLIVRHNNKDVATITDDGAIYFSERKASIKNGVLYSSGVEVGDVVMSSDGLFVKSGELVINQTPNKIKVGFSIFDGVSKIITFLRNSNFIRFLKNIVAPKITIQDSTAPHDTDTFTGELSITDKDEVSVLSISSDNKTSRIKSLKPTVVDVPSFKLPKKTIYEGEEIGGLFVKSKEYSVDKATYVTKDGDKVLSDESFTKKHKEKLESIKTSKVSEGDGGYVVAEDVRDNLNKRVSTSNKLSDLELVDEKSQRAACSHLGAAFAKDYEVKKSDTGWLNMLDYASGEMRDLHVRQIGNTVYIAGEINTNRNADGVFAILPNGVSEPSFDVHTRHTDISRTQGNSGIDLGIKSKTRKLIQLDRRGYDNQKVLVNMVYLTN